METMEGKSNKVLNGTYTLDRIFQEGLNIIGELTTLNK